MNPLLTALVTIASFFGLVGSFYIGWYMDDWFRKLFSYRPRFTDTHLVIEPKVNLVDTSRIKAGGVYADRIKYVDTTSDEYIAKCFRDRQKLNEDGREDLLRILEEKVAYEKQRTSINNCMNEFKNYRYENI